MVFKAPTLVGVLYFDIAYTKSDPHPSLIIGTIGSTRSTNIPLILGIVAALGVAGLLVFQLLKTRPRLKPVKGHAARGVPGAAARRNVQNRHCNQCGNTVDSSDKFCSRCGSKINR